MTRTLGAAAVLLACALSACGTSGSGGARPSATSSSTPSSTSVTRAAPSSAPSSAPASTSRPESQAAAAPDACAGNASGRLVLVRVKAQHLWMCQGPRTVRDTAVTTGILGENTHTPKGRYRVQMPSKNTVLTLASGQTYDVKFWIPFDAPLFGFHDSSWQKFPYGSPKYRTDGSHGCVHVPLAAIRFLFDWVDVGTRVHIV